MASIGGRAPPGQNTRWPCAGSHWPGAARGSPLQRLDAFALVSARVGPLALVALGLPNPVRQGLRPAADLGAIEAIAGHCDGCSVRCSNTIRTARSRTSVENFGDVLWFAIAPISQGLEPPTNPGRFSSLFVLTGDHREKRAAVLPPRISIVGWQCPFPSSRHGAASRPRDVASRGAPRRCSTRKFHMGPKDSVAACSCVSERLTGRRASPIAANEWNRLQMLNYGFWFWG